MEFCEWQEFVWNKLDTLRGKDVSIRTTSYFKCMLLQKYNDLGGDLPIKLNLFESSFQRIKLFVIWICIQKVMAIEADLCHMHSQMRGRTYFGVSALCAPPLAQVCSRACRSPLNNPMAG